MGDFLDDVSDFTGGFTGDVLGLGQSSGEKAAKEAKALYDALQAPELQDITLERLSEVGDPRDFLTRLQDSEMKGIQVSPALKQAQMGALQKLQQISESGFTPEDQARLRQIGREEAIRERGQREAITQTAQRRGTAGSGLEFASLLGAEQGAAERAAERGLGVQQLAAQRSLDALQAGANLAGNIRGQEFGEQADIARSQDIINQFNAASRNQAGLMGFQNRQNISNQNVGLANQQQLTNRLDLPQQRFENAQTVAGLRAGAIQNVGAQRGSRNALLGDRITQAATMAAGLPPMPMGGGGSGPVGQVISGLPIDDPRRMAMMAA